MDVQVEVYEQGRRKLFKADILDNFIEQVLNGQLKRAALLVIAMLKESNEPLHFVTDYDHCNQYELEGFCGGDFWKAVEILYVAGFIKWNKKKGGYYLAKKKVANEMLSGEIIIES